MNSSTFSACRCPSPAVVLLSSRSLSFLSLSQPRPHMPWSVCHRSRSGSKAVLDPSGSAAAATITLLLGTPWRALRIKTSSS